MKNQNFPESDPEKENTEVSQHSAIPADDFCMDLNGIFVQISCTFWDPVTSVCMLMEYATDCFPYASLVSTRIVLVAQATCTVLTSQTHRFFKNDQRGVSHASMHSKLPILPITFVLFVLNWSYDWNHT